MGITFDALLANKLLCEDETFLRLDQYAGYLISSGVPTAKRVSNVGRGHDAKSGEKVSMVPIRLNTAPLFLFPSHPSK